jgi:transcription elongation factor GreA
MALAPRYTAALAAARGPDTRRLKRRLLRFVDLTTYPRFEGHMQKDVILTPEGLEKLKDELEQLSTAKRREVAERIKEAREFGDISENSEYDDAKNEQAMIESRILQLQEKLRMATVIEAKDLSTDVVQVGSVVHVKDEKTGKSVKYTIVGSAEAKPQENKLSNESPVGRALLGRKRNETVAVKVPRGPARKLKITKIDGPVK